MVLAIPRSESEMWIGGSEGGGEGAEGRSEGETVLDRGGGGKEKEGEGGGNNWECAEITRGKKKKKLLLCCTFPLRIPTRPIYSLSVTPPPPPSLYKHQHTWSEFVDEGLASVSVFSEQKTQFIETIVGVFAQLFVLIEQATTQEREQKKLEDFCFCSKAWCPISFTPGI